jgi:hypothetical protein
MTLVIEDAHDLDRTARLAAGLARPAVGQVHVRLPWLDHAEQARSASALARLFNECGCLWGAPAFLSVLAWGALGAPWSTLGTLAAIGVSMLLATTAGLAAVVFALVWSRWRLQVLLAQLARGGVISQRPCLSE